MTPAILAAAKAKIHITVHEYEHDPACTAFGLEAAEKLGVDPRQVFKTLVADLGGELVVAVIPVQAMLALNTWPGRPEPKGGHGRQTPG